MSVGKPERTTQYRVIAMFRDERKYQYPGEWTARKGKSQVGESLPGRLLWKRERCLR
jgi:type I restriction enzyme R subunit